MKFNKSFLVSLFSVSLLGMMLIGVNNANAALVTCGTGKDMCTLCDLIKGMNTIIQYLMRISIGVALLAMAIGGVMYVVSAGDKGMIDKAKGTMKNAAYGFVIIFAGWLIISTTIKYLGTKSDMGIRVTSWDKFECTRTVPVSN